MAAKDTGLRDLARQLAQLDRRVRATSSTGQLAHSSIEDGAVQAYDRDGNQTMLIGKQWDGTYTSTVVTGPVPPTPSAPLIIDGTEGISVRWDGTFEDGAVVPMDYLRVDIHISAVDGFIPDYSNRYGTIIPPTGGEVAFHLAPGVWYVRLICWSQAGVPSSTSAQATGTANAIPSNPTDGDAPAASPTPEVFSGIQEMYVRWTPVVNADPVTYDVHVSETMSFTPDSTTKVGDTRSNMFTIRALPGDPPTEGEDDPRQLHYDTPYYIAVVARDDDGAAAPSSQAVGFILQATGSNLAVGSVAAQHILTGTLTGDLFSATVILAGIFKTAETGQRVEMGPDGLQGYRSDGSLMFNLPTDPTQQVFMDADVVARSLTATGPVTMRSNANSVEKDAIVKLRNGIASPSAVPQLGISYLTTTFSTTSLTDAQRTGALGMFDFKGSEVSCVEWKDSGAYWVVHQIRPAGTRAWFFDWDGTPLIVGSTYFHDYTDWEIWSVIEITTSSTPAKNGVYRIARWIPSGASNTYYLWSPFGLNRYSRQNNQPPVVGTNGQDVYVAEVVGTQLWIRYFATLTGDQTNAIATTVYKSAQGFTSSHPLSNVTYDAAGFDIGSPRYIVSERGFTTDNKLVYTSGSNDNSIFLGGSGGSWVSSTVNAETFETAPTNPRCTVWDGSNFWTMGGDGVLYQYTDTYWDPSVDSSVIWLEHTFKDNNAAGTGQHETTPGPAKSINWKRRSKIRVFMPPIPGAGGVDEPNAVTVYAGRGVSQPANSGFHQQYEGNTPVADFSAFDFTDPIPPTVNTFPNTNPGKITSDDGNMVISGDGTIKIGGKDVALGTPTITRITASGTWTKPAGLKAAFVECVGGGGGAGGLSNGSTNQGETGPGGGGSWSGKWYLAGDLSATESVTIGAGGNGGTTAGTNGTAGGSTLFKGQTAGPGAGGTGYSTTPRAAAIVVPGGAGGVATGGDMNLTGEPGGLGRTITGLVLLQSRGGSSPKGYGFGGVINNVSGTGNTGTGYGAGGGACWHGAGTAAAGAPGTQGIVIITCYF